MLRSSVFVVLVALAVLVAAAVSADARVVVAPQPISPRGRVVQGIKLAVGGNRTAVLMDTYLESGGRPHDFALLARVGEGARPGRLQRLPGGGGVALGGADVAVGGDGTAVAAWIDDKGRRVSALRVAVAAPGRSFGPPQTIERVSTRYRHQLGGVVMTAGGRSVVTWMDPEDARVRAAIREPGKRFGPPITLDAGPSQPAAVAAAPWGTVLVSWSRGPSPTTEPAVMARTLNPGAKRFSAPVTLTQPAYVGRGPVAVSGTGGAGVTWQQRTSNDNRPAPMRMLSAPTRDGRFVTSRLPFPIAAIELGEDTLRLALPSTGRVVAAWADRYPGTTPGRTIKSSTIGTSTRAPGRRSFSPVRRLSASGWKASPPALGVLGDRTVAAWAERRQGTSRLRVAVRPDRGGWNPPRTIPGGYASGVYAAGSRQRVAVVWGSSGRTRLAWVTR